MRLAMPAPPEMLPWLAQRANLTMSPTLQAIAAVDDDGQIAGMVGFDGWTMNACAMHVAIEKPIAVRTLLRPAFELPFVRLGLGVVVGTVLSSNERALALDLHLGFREVMRGRDWWAPGVDLVWLEMRREECRWLCESERKAA